ncbi:MAG: DUF4363 family protein [Clostridia bacterium]|nr:DUF4363 family protein [Clostridia bacterium]
MKSFMVAMIIFVLIILGSGYYSYALTKSIDNIEVKLSEVEASLLNHNWDECNEKTEALMQDWEKTQKWLKAIVNHKEIDVIIQALYEMKGYIRVKNKEEALVTVGVLRMFFRHIPENESLALINIL